MVIYNDSDPYVVEWLRNLIAAGQLPDGIAVKQSIQNLQGAPLRGDHQFHAFAGIGGWPLALRLAGWPDDASVWTGSCPYQPFSIAGRKKGVEPPLLEMSSQGGYVVR